MNSVANQKIITVKKEPCDKTNTYFTLNLKAFNKAIKVLSGAEFKVYMYFVSNQDNYSFALSKKDVCNVCNVGATKYHEVINKFIEKGYLKNTKSNKYEFVERGNISENDIVCSESDNEVYQKVTHDISENDIDCSENDTDTVSETNIEILRNNINNTTTTTTNNTVEDEEESSSIKEEVSINFLSVWESLDKVPEYIGKITTYEEVFELLKDEQKSPETIKSFVNQRNISEDVFFGRINYVKHYMEIVEESKNKYKCKSKLSAIIYKESYDSIVNKMPDEKIYLDKMKKEYDNDERVKKCMIYYNQMNLDNKYISCGTVSDFFNNMVRYCKLIDPINKEYAAKGYTRPITYEMCGFKRVIRYKILCALATIDDYSEQEKTMLTEYNDRFFNIPIDEIKAEEFNIFIEGKRKEDGKED